MTPIDLPALVRELNPWWDPARSAAADLPKFERDIVEQLLGELRQSEASGGRRRAIVLSGLRQVGKTIALKQAAWRLVEGGPNRSDVIYFDFSDPRGLSTTIEQLLVALFPAGASLAEKVLLLDEVGRDPHWTDSVKRLVDLGAGAPRMVVSDSAVARLQASAGETAQGRRIDRTLEPMSFAEIARFFGRYRDDPRDADPLALGLLSDDYLLRGGLPEHVTPWSRGEPVERSHERIRRDIAFAITHDAPRLREVRETAALEILWSGVARGVSLSVNVSRLASGLAISQPTVRSLLELLRDIRLTYELPSFLPPTGGGPWTAARHPARIMVCDPGIAAAHLPRVQLETPDARGRLVESAVFRHLREFAARTRGAGLSYARFAAARDSEVDFVVEPPGGGLVVVEAKHGAVGGDSRLVNRLAKLARELRAERGVLVSRDPAFRRWDPDGTEVISVPLWAFLCWPDRALRGGLGV